MLDHWSTEESRWSPLALEYLSLPASSKSLLGFWLFWAGRDSGWEMHRPVGLGRGFPERPVLTDCPQGLGGGWLVLTDSPHLPIP